MRKAKESGDAVRSDELAENLQQVEHAARKSYTRWTHATDAALIVGDRDPPLPVPVAFYWCGMVVC